MLEFLLVARLAGLGMLVVLAAIGSDIQWVRNFGHVLVPKIGHCGLHKICAEVVRKSAEVLVLSTF